MAVKIFEKVINIEKSENQDVQKIINDLIHTYIIDETKIINIVEDAIYPYYFIKIYCRD